MSQFDAVKFALSDLWASDAMRRVWQAASRFSTDPFSRSTDHAHESEAFRNIPLDFRLESPP